MTKISINFAKNPLDVYDVVPPLGNDYHLFLQSMDNSRLCDLAVRRMPQNYRVTDARVLGMSNIILNQNGHASLENICFNPNISDKVIDKEEMSFTAVGKQIEFSTNAETTIDNAVFIGGHWNFGHWLFNHIGRFCFISDELRKDATFLLPTSLTETQIEMLKYFGVESSNMLLIKPGTLVNVRQLLVPQMPWHSISEFGTWWSPGVFKELRKKLGLHTASVTNASRKVLLSRKNTRWRRLVNEDEIYKSLEKFGFEMIDIGTLSIKQQFELGQQTSCLITPLGANSNFFLNLPSGANVIELAPPMEFMNVTGPFATASGLKYKQIVGTANNTPGIPKIDQDYFVDCSLVVHEFCSLTA
tara:strand:+ start:327 stop:1403 length:1077 start_codon:yes stop_codon:yes gene_type:complete